MPASDADNVLDLSKLLNLLLHLVVDTNLEAH